MWTKSYEVITKEVSAEQMWKLTTDINNWKNWDETVEHSELLNEFKVGSFFLLKPKGGPKVKIKIIELKENQKFVDETSFPLAKMTGEHIFEETENGLKIKVTMQVKGILRFVWIQLVAKGIVANLEKDLLNQIQHAKKIEL